MCALHGGTALASAVLRSSSDSSPSLLDEALAVAEGLVMRQHDDLLSAGALRARAGWGVLGAVVASSPPRWLRTKARRLSEVWQRSVQWAGDDSSQAAAEVRLTCLEACLSSVAALCESGSPLLEGKLGQDIARLLTQTRSILASKQLQTSRSFARLALCAAALLEAQASLPCKDDATLSFRWCCGYSSAAGGVRPTRPSRTAPLQLCERDAGEHDVRAARRDWLRRRRLAGGPRVSRIRPRGCSVPGGRGVRRGRRRRLRVESGGAVYGDALGPGERDVLAALAVGRTGDLPAERAGETRARLVDACVRCLRALIPRVDADAQRQGLDALAGALEAALNPAKLAMMASDDEKRKRDLRCAACARNASMALLACVSNLPRTYATRPDPTADPFGPPKLLSDAPFGDKPRDALARAWPRRRRARGARPPRRWPLWRHVCRTPELGSAPRARPGRRLREAGRAEESRDSARRAAAAPAVAEAAREKVRRDGAVGLRRPGDAADQGVSVVIDDGAGLGRARAERRRARFGPRGCGATAPSS